MKSSHYRLISLAYTIEEKYFIKKQAGIPILLGIASYLGWHAVSTYFSRRAEVLAKANDNFSKNCQDVIEKIPMIQSKMQDALSNTNDAGKREDIKEDIELITKQLQPTLMRIKKNVEDMNKIIDVRSAGGAVNENTVGKDKSSYLKEALPQLAKAKEDLGSIMASLESDKQALYRANEIIGNIETSYLHDFFANHGVIENDKQFLSNSINAIVSKIDRTVRNGNTIIEMVDKIEGKARSESEAPTNTEPTAKKTNTNTNSEQNQSNAEQNTPIENVPRARKKTTYTPIDESVQENLNKLSKYLDKDNSSGIFPIDVDGKNGPITTRALGMYCDWKGINKDTSVDQIAASINQDISRISGTKNNVVSSSTRQSTTRQNDNSTNPNEILNSALS